MRSRGVSGVHFVQDHFRWWILRGTVTTIAYSA